MELPDTSVSRPPPSEAVRKVSIYSHQAPLQPVELRLGGNEGRAPSVSWLRKASKGLLDAVNRYPDARGLEEAIAARLGITAEGVLVTAGGDEALDRICRAYLSRGREIILPSPTFEMIPRYATLAGGSIVEVPWWEDRYPVEEVIAKKSARAGIVAVISPNNPTGTYATREDLQAIARAFPDSLLVVDQAYVEFTDHDLTKEIVAIPNAVGVRTFSKGFGLAGLRVGFVFGEPSIIEVLRAAGGPYPVARSSIVLAGRCWNEPDPARAGVIARVRQEREELFDLLLELGTKPLRSQANFVLAQTRNADPVRDLLLGMGVEVRSFPKLKQSVRITCPGDRREFGRLKHALRSSLKPQALLFDLDGVLADVTFSYRATIIEACQSFGVTVTPEMIKNKKLEGGFNNDWLLTHRLLKDHGVEVDFNVVRERFELIYQGTDLNPGLRTTEKPLVPRKLLSELAGKLPLALVTGRPRLDVQRFLREQESDTFFRTFVCMEDGPLKPDPAPVLCAMRRLRVKHAWMIGDAVDDIRAARAARTVPVAVFNPSDRSSEAERALLEAGAALVMRDTEEILDLLKCTSIG